MPDFAAFGAAMGVGGLPELPKLPGQKTAPRQRIAPPPLHDDEPGPRSIDDAMPSQKLDKPVLDEQAPPEGDEQMELDPSSDFPIPSTPNQRTPGDDQMNGPLFGHGVRQASYAPRAAPPEVRDAIVRAAKEDGVSPAYALATAERESSFNPNAGGTGTIRGLFQMTGGLRKKYGIEDGADAYSQAKGFNAFTKDLRGEMAKGLKREPTDEETYLGHHFGGTRAARIVSGSIAPDTPVEQVFTPNELRGNPHLRGSIGNVSGSIRADMTRRMGGHQQPADDFAQFGAPADRQGATPGMDPNLPAADQEATAEAQVPAMIKGAYYPEPKAWDAAIASMPQSKNIDDRRAETGPSMMRQARDGFAEYGRALGDAVGMNAPPDNEFTRNIPEAAAHDFAAYGQTASAP